MKLPRLASALIFLGMLASAHGVVWTRAAIPTDGHLSQVVYGARKFLAIADTYGYPGGNGGELAWSANGLSWSVVDTPGAFSFLASSGGSSFIGAGSQVAANSQVVVYSSTTGLTWVPAVGCPTLSRIDDVVYSGGKYVVFGKKTVLTASQNVVVYSTLTTRLTITGLSSSLSWTLKVMDFGMTSQTINAVSYGNGLFVASAQAPFYLSGTSTLGGTTAFYTSTDAANWTKRTITGTDHINRIRFLNNQFVAVGTGGAIYTSSEGSTWIKRATSSNDTLHDVTFGNALLVAVGTTGCVLTSPDGVVWSKSPTGIWSNLNGIAFGGTQFLTTGLNEAILQGN